MGAGRQEKHVTSGLAEIEAGLLRYPQLSDMEQRRIGAELVPFLLNRALAKEGEGLLAVIIAEAAPYVLPESGVQKVMAGIHNDSALCARLLKISRCLLVNPIATSREILNALGDHSSRPIELRPAYHILQQLLPMQDLFHRESPQPRVVTYLKHMIGQAGDVEKVFRGGTIKPRQVEFHLALGCNLLCLGCSNIEIAPGGKRSFIPYPKLGRPLSVEQAGMLLDMFVAQGVEYFSFSGGGEPFCYPGLLPLIQGARQRHSEDINIGLYTNGLGLVRLLESDRDVLTHSLDRLRVSLDAADPEQWAKYKGLPPSRRLQLKDVLEALKGLAGRRAAGAKNMLIGASFIISKFCQPSELRQIIDVCVSNGLDFCDIKVYAESDPSKRSFNIGLGIGELVHETLTNWREGCFGKLDLSFEDPFLTDLFAWKHDISIQPPPHAEHCWMARLGKKLTIGPYGELYPCSDAANPGVLGALNQEPRMCVLDEFRATEDLGRQFLKLWEDTLCCRQSFKPKAHPYCVPSNADYNLAGEKLFRDFCDGILLADQFLLPAHRGTYYSRRGLPDPSASRVRHPHHVAPAFRVTRCKSALRRARDGVRAIGGPASPAFSVSRSIFVSGGGGPVPLLWTHSGVTCQVRGPRKPMAEIRRAAKPPVLARDHPPCHGRLRRWLTEPRAGRSAVRSVEDHPSQTRISAFREVASANRSLLLGWARPVYFWHRPIPAWVSVN